ncbi:hypothetical protein NAEGRDRAFT_78810 [Naegleria gruberi]|uniref:Peptidase M28 domain-containing protein n=1 Tax=Naegleria gruberi TaxID=5762 RepID=D2V6N7_NAEGR|nr:uncharacterized protein NAEGRDRAFT_78810 [Naegleria gruberi]EFC47609.1 hypothetical protein NAEGRDRAFT_78810 [Naegleria gruberi]|eukprot:XP_002680353.1 hypothetical protein NAEGRDRAFT_78810 [Naegleria gruberi strain NEG-M]
MFSLRYWCFTLYPSNFLYAPCIWLFIPVLLFGSAILIGLLGGRQMPFYLEQSTVATSFSEDRARIYLKALTTNNDKPIVRVPGSLAALTARDYIYNLTNTWASKTTGSYGLEVQKQDYHQFSNVLVRVTPKTTTQNVDDMHSFLVASHYDSVEFSAGASSAASGVATMLELIYNLISQDTTTGPTYPVVFFFGGGSTQSTPEATVAFMKNHQWSKKCLRFVNLDSVGSGGKAMVSRMTDQSIIGEYGNVHPYISVIGYELSRLTTYTNDYDVFSSRDYRNTTLPKFYLKGMDYAYYWDGYYYGTKFDTYDVVGEKTLQHLGDNVLAQILSVTRNEKIMEESNTEYEANYDADIVYFDILGGFTINLSFGWSQAIQGIIVVVDLVLPIVLVIIDHMISLRYHDTSSVYQLFKKSTTGLQARLLYLVLYLGGYVLSLGFGILFAAVLGAIVDGIQHMPWYRDPVLAIFLFALPTLLGMFLAQYGVHVIGNAVISGCGCFKMYRVSMKDKSELKAGENTAAQTLVYAIDKERYLALTFFWGLLTAASLCTQLKSFYIVYFWSFCLSGMLIILLVLDRVIMWTYLIVRNKTRAKALEAMGATMTEELTEAGDDVNKRKKFLELRRKKKEDELSKDDSSYLNKLAKKRNLRHEIASQLSSFTWKDFFHALHYHQLYWFIFMAIASWPPLTVTIDILDRFSHMLIPLMSRANYPVSGAMIGSAIGLIIFLMTISYMPSMHRAANFGKVLIVNGLALALVIIIAIASSGFTSTTPRKIKYAQNTKIGGAAITAQSTDVTTALSIDGVAGKSVTFDLANSLSSITMQSFDGISVRSVLSTYKSYYGMDSSIAFHRESCSTYKCEFVMWSGTTSSKYTSYHLHLKQLDIFNVVNTFDDNYNYTTLTLKVSLNEKLEQGLFKLSLSGDNSTITACDLNSADTNKIKSLYYHTTDSGVHSLYKYGMTYQETLIDVQIRTSKYATSLPTLALSNEVYECEISGSEVVSAMSALYDAGKYYLTPLGSGSCDMLTESSTVNIKITNN